MKKHVIILYALVTLGHCVPTASALGPDIDRACKALERIADSLDAIRKRGSSLWQ